MGKCGKLFFRESLKSKTSNKTFASQQLSYKQRVSGIEHSVIAAKTWNTLVHPIELWSALVKKAPMLPDAANAVKSRE